MICLKINIQKDIYCSPVTEKKKCGYSLENKLVTWDVWERDRIDLQAKVIISYVILSTKKSHKISSEK